MTERFIKRLQKKTKRGMRGWPAATVAYYGPDMTRASKVVVGIMSKTGSEPLDMRSWKHDAVDVRSDQTITSEILAFIEANGALSVVMTDGIFGCPHEQGIDYEGDWCPDPRCTFWYKRDRHTGKPVT
jgi:hypothetical protein